MIIFRRILPLILGYSILTGICNFILTISTIGLNQNLRNAFSIVLFISCISLSLFNIRRKIGSKINYKRAAFSAVCISFVSILVSISANMLVYQFKLPLSMFLLTFVNRFVLTLPISLIVAIFFKHSDKEVDLLRRELPDILDDGV
jgi:hypothetical protein